MKGNRKFRCRGKTAAAAAALLREIHKQTTAGGDKLSIAGKACTLSGRPVYISIILSILLSAHSSFSNVSMRLQQIVMAT